MVTRRAWVLAAAAVPAGRTLGAAASTPKDIVISSANGLQACARAYQMIKGGADTLDAVVAGVNIPEEDPEDNSVGYGGLPNEDGVVELDASVMHGPSRRIGSVASIRGIKTPSKIAKLVMEQTDHTMLVGEGALRFAKAFGFKEEDLLTEKSRLAWLVWKQSLRDGIGHNNWREGLDAPPKKPTAVPPSAVLKRMFPDATDEMLEWARGMAAHPPTGTINCLGLNAKGEMSGVTTTSGLAWKLAGRVGDSPLIGSGVFVDQEVGGAGSTGRGEENIRIVGAHTIVENMRHGLSANDACLDALQRVAHNFQNDRARLLQFDLNFYALRKDGQYCGSSLWDTGVDGNRVVPHRFAVNDGGESRLENSVFLFRR